MVSWPGWNAGTIVSRTTSGRRKMPKLTVRYLVVRTRNAAARSRPSMEGVGGVSTGGERGRARRARTLARLYRREPPRLVTRGETYISGLTRLSSIWFPGGGGWGG